jgi:hypothetical protein
LDAWHVTDWQRDPFSREAYSSVAAGNVDAPHRLADAVEDTLFFAREATDKRVQSPEHSPTVFARPIKSTEQFANL